MFCQCGLNVRNLYACRTLADIKDIFSGGLAGLLLTTRKIRLQARRLCSSRGTMPIIAEQSAVHTQLTLATRFVWDSRLLSHRKYSVNWTVKKTSWLLWWIRRAQQPTSHPAPSACSVPVPSVSHFPVYQPRSVSSVPAPSVSMGAYSVNLVIPEGTDTQWRTVMMCDIYY